MSETELLEAIWRFVRGDTDAASFEQWLYAHSELEDTLGNALYLELISADYRNVEAIRHARDILEGIARKRSILACECVTLPDTAIIGMADPGQALTHFQELRRRGEPFWWLGVSMCTACNTPWLVAQEERQNDVFLLRRLSSGELARIVDDGQWPTDFDAYETLLRLGRAAGHSATFLDPVGDSSLAWSIKDLAHERPGITLLELAELLNLDLATAAIIAEQAVVKHGAVIDLGDQSER